ncbi:hypothetical protein DKM44_08605 [Deinococcus irradiatisoli]|uniref:Uncharacterized protein n=1 Tax=Deinococcus irradiatisoli TaxID=2202254 RepID=A0A2Z3JIT6_9DEIO|nr:BTAD domain-containing putative transcriptional regulator [Deinococcus irradiatisoli]AWN23280.1 hypothetical protein DKM44_08605 [Deinococcus irradiatisoli]
MIGLTLLGRGEIQAGELTVRFPTRRAAALCAYLALEGPAARARLAALLWEDHTEASGRVNLRQELRRLRSTPLGPHLLAEGDHLRLSPEVTSDARHFEDLAGRGEYALALAHYGGALLEGTEFFDAPQLAEWLDGQRQRWQERWTEALSAQALALEQRGDLRAALEIWQRLLRGDELRERSHAEVMRLHLRLGEREAALRQFARCRDVLRDELGLTPLPATLRLAEQARLSVLPSAAPPPPVVPAPPPLMVGREDAAAALRSRSGMTLILGEPGIGKSTLVRAVCGHVKVLVLGGHELGQHTPFSPATAALERHLAGLTRSEQAALDPMLPGRHLPPDPALRAGFRRAVARIMQERLGADGVLVLEDLHWFDSATCEVLLDVLERCAQVGTWVLATARPHELSQNAPASALCVRLRRLTLGPLGAEALAELTRSWTSQPPDPAFVAWLQDATAGNPLAARETLRSLREHTPGPLKVPAEREAAPVRALLLERVDRLGAAARRALEAACVCGSAFSVRQLAGTTALDEWACLEALEQAALAGILEAQGEAFVFTHDLFRRSLLSALSPARAALLHRHMAAELARSGGAPERVAQHLAAAGEDASGWWWKAALAAERVYAYPQALAHSERALGGPLPAALRLECLRRRLLWWRTVDDRQGWQGEVERLEALAYRQGDSLWWTEARLARLEWLFQGGRYGEVLALGAQVLGDPNVAAEQRARALLECGNACIYLGQHAEAARHHREALTLPGVTLHERPELFGRLHHSLTASALDTGDLPLARRHSELARQGFERAGSRMGQLRSLFNAFAIADRAGEAGAARTTGLLALELAREMDDLAHQRLALSNLAAQAIAQDQADPARDALSELERLGIEPDDVRLAWWLRLHWAEVARLEGDPARAVACYAAARDLCFAPGLEQQRFETDLNEAELLLDLHRPAEARRLLGHRAGAANTAGRDLVSLDHDVVAARLLLWAGQTEAACLRLQQVLSGCGTENIRFYHRAALHLASALIDLGDLDGAAGWLRRLEGQGSAGIQARRLALRLRLPEAAQAVAPALGLLQAGQVPPIEKLELLSALTALDPAPEWMRQAETLRQHLAALPALGQVAPTQPPTGGERWISK